VCLFHVWCTCVAALIGHVDRARFGAGYLHHIRECSSMHGWIRLTACLQQTTCRLRFFCFCFLRRWGFLFFGLFVLPLCCFPRALAFLCFLVGLFGLPFSWLPCGVGLSLFSFWFICTAPVRGGTYFSLPAAKKSRQKKAGSHRQLLGVHHWRIFGVVRARSEPSHPSRP
jgi:hypothetical protein